MSADALYADLRVCTALCIAELREALCREAFTERLVRSGVVIYYG